MSDFSRVIGCDKVGQQPLVQSVLKGSKKFKPQGSKREETTLLMVFGGSQWIKKTPVVCKVNCFSLDTVHFKMMSEAFRMRSGRLKMGNPEPPLQLGAWAVLQETPSCWGPGCGKVSPLARDMGMEHHGNPSRPSCVARGKSLKLSVSSSVK